MFLEDRTKEAGTVISILQNPGAALGKMQNAKSLAGKVFLALEILLVNTECDSLEGRVGLYLINCVPRDCFSILFFKKIKTQVMPQGSPGFIVQANILCRPFWSSETVQEELTQK